MKKLLAIVVLGLFFTGCSENQVADKLIVLKCIGKLGDKEQLAINLKKNTLTYLDEIYSSIDLVLKNKDFFSSNILLKLLSSILCNKYLSISLFSPSSPSS